MASSDRDSLRTCLCACLSCLPENIQGAKQALSTLASSQWPAFLDFAASHGVLAVIAPVVAISTAPDHVRTDLERRLLVQRMWTQQVADVLGECLSLLQAAGVEACPLKGPPLAERLYETRLDRPSIDVDILVRPSQLDAARQAMLGAMFVGDDAMAASYLSAHSHHLHFTKANTPEVELHFQAYHGFGTILPAEALLDRATPASFGRVPIRVPSPEDELIYLAAHAAGHSFIRLLWLFDLKRLVATQAIDWRAVSDRSQAYGLTTVVGYAMHLLREWLGVSAVPMAAMRVAKGRKWAADRLLDTVATPSVPSAADNLGGLAFTAVLCDSLSNSSALVGHHLARALRHRAHRAVPGLVPESWSA